LIVQIWAWNEYKRPEDRMLSVAIRGSMDFARNYGADMLPTMQTSRTRLPRIAIVGAGKLGTALAISLQAAGYQVAQIGSRGGAASQRRAKALARRVGAQAVIVEKSELDGELVWLCVPDGALRRRPDQR
jgi:ketol-acid reductoisomerase